MQKYEGIQEERTEQDEMSTIRMQIHRSLILSLLMGFCVEAKNSNPRQNFNCCNFDYNFGFGRFCEGKEKYE